MDFVTAYGPKRASRLRFVDTDGDPLDGALSLTEQSHCKRCDVNNILAQYDKTGLITHVNKAVAEYGDFTLVNEYQESLNTVIAAREAFAELPSKIRARFNNDPGEFFEFATNPDNGQAMVDLGLAEVPIPAPPTKVEVVNQPVADPS